MIRVDNGPEFISDKFDFWCKANKIQLVYIQPGKPTQHAFVERFSGSIRKELLNAYIFRTLSEVRKMAEEWKQDNNHTESSCRESSDGSFRWHVEVCLESKINTYL